MEKLNCKSLMIGDWVYNSIADITFQVYPQFFSQWHNKSEQFEATIRPIPLTPEILEKNGFIVKRTESAKRAYWKDRAGQIVGHKNRGLMHMEISGNPVKFGYFLPHFSGHIQFVHELQHALRLCGIEKEIVL